MVSIASQLTFEPDATQMRRHVCHLFEGWLDGCHEGRIELAWRDAEDGKLRHAMTFGTDELDELESALLCLGSSEDEVERLYHEARS